MNSVFFLLTNKKIFFFSFGCWLLPPKISVCPKNNGFARVTGDACNPLSTLARTPMSAAGSATKCSCTQSIPCPNPSHSFFPLFPSSFPSLSFPSFPFLSLPLFTHVRHGVGRAGGRTSAPPLDPPLHGCNAVTFQVFFKILLR